MKLTSITIEEKTGILRRNEPVGLGVPFAKGKVKNTSHILLKNQGETVITQKKVLQQWSDGSIRWLLLDFLADLSPNQKKEYDLHIENSHQVCKNFPLNISWQTNTSKQHFVSLHYKNVDYNFSCILSDNKQNYIDLQLQSTKRQTLKTTMLFTGTYKNQINISLALDIFVDSLCCQITIHNPRRARHKGNLWDLGDQGSFFFDSFDIKINAPIIKATTNIVNGNFKNLHIHQILAAEKTGVA